MTVLEKAIYNSYWPTYISNFFHFNNIEIANKITKEGRKAITYMLNSCNRGKFNYD